MTSASGGSALPAELSVRYGGCILLIHGEQVAIRRIRIASKNAFQQFQRVARLGGCSPRAVRVRSAKFQRLGLFR